LREKKKKKKEWERFGSVAVELTRGSKTPVAGGSPVACCKLQTDAGTLMPPRLTSKWDFKNQNCVRLVSITLTL